MFLLRPETYADYIEPDDYVAPEDDLDYPYDGFEGEIAYLKERGEWVG